MPAAPVPAAPVPMAPVPAVPALPISDADRERAADVLTRACGDARLTLEEFSVRVGAVWAADTTADLTRATEGLAAAPPVGLETAETVTNLFGESSRIGHWRVPRKLHVRNWFGECTLDLRGAALATDAVDAHTVEIKGICAFGRVNVIVPEGVDVDAGGAVIFGARSIHLAPVQRLPGTPTIRVPVRVIFGELSVVSREPDAVSPIAAWTRRMLD